MEADERPPRWARWFVAVFLVAFIACGLGGVEAWPLSGFRLFSGLRQRIDEGYEVRVVTGSGTESPIALEPLGLGYRSIGLLLAADADPTGREAMCAAFVARLRSTGVDAVSLRVYSVAWDRGDRRGDRPAQARAPVLAYGCGASP